MSWVGANQSSWFSFSGMQGGVQAEFTIGSLQFRLVTNAAVVKFRGEWYLTPAHTTWVIEMLKDAGT